MATAACDDYVVVASDMELVIARERAVVMSRALHNLSRTVIELYMNDHQDPYPIFRSALAHAIGSMQSIENMLTQTALNVLHALKRVLMEYDEATYGKTATAFYLTFEKRGLFEVINRFRFREDL